MKEKGRPKQRETKDGINTKRKREKFDEKRKKRENSEQKGDSRRRKSHE